MELIRFDKDKHYDIVKQWWDERTHAVIPKSSLSPYGLIVFNNGKPVCVSWIYLFHGSDMAQMAWLTTNPESGLKEKYVAVNKCIFGLTEFAKNNERKILTCFSNSSGLNKVLGKTGMGNAGNHSLYIGKLEE